MKPAPEIKLTTACKQPETLATFLQAGFEQDLYASAFQNLADLNNKLRFNNFAYAIRELMRHVLNRLAPTETSFKVDLTRSMVSQRGATIPWVGSAGGHPLVLGMTGENVRDAILAEEECPLQGYFVQWHLTLAAY